MTDGESTGDEKRDRDETSKPKRRGIEHLSNVADGCGCAEVWEHTSERRSDRE